MYLNSLVNLRETGALVPGTPIAAPRIAEGVAPPVTAFLDITLDLNYTFVKLFFTISIVTNRRFYFKFRATAYSEISFCYITPSVGQRIIFIQQSLLVQ